MDRVVLVSNILVKYHTQPEVQKDILTAVRHCEGHFHDFSSKFLRGAFVSAPSINNASWINNEELVNITDKYLPGSPEDETFKSLKELLVSKPFDSSTGEAVKALIKEHAENPTLYADLKRAATIVLSMIQESLAIVGKTSGQGV